MSVWRQHWDCVFFEDITGGGPRFLKIVWELCCMSVNFRILLESSLISNKCNATVQPCDTHINVCQVVFHTSYCVASCFINSGFLLLKSIATRLTGLQSRCVCDTYKSKVPLAECCTSHCKNASTSYCDRSFGKLDSSSIAFSLSTTSSHRFLASHALSSAP